ncbi:MAG: hypothetical protein ACR2QC_09785 [Gammaproteobacteria bacterium]
MAVMHYAKDNETRVRRAESWCSQGETMGDWQIRFLCFWIAMDALYGRGETAHIPQSCDVHARNFSRPKPDWKEFSEGVIKADESAICEVLRQCNPSIRKLLELRYVYPQFWKAMYDPSLQNSWKKGFDSDIAHYERWNTAKKFDAVFERLRVVRNQIMHGAMTRAKDEGSYGATQVRLGVFILYELVPCLVRIVENHPRDWGKVPYPRTGDEPDDPRGQPIPRKKPR